MSIPTPPEVPGLKPLLFLNVEALEPISLYTNESENFTTVPIEGGFIKSLDQENFPFTAKITNGADDIRKYSHSGEVGNLDCRLYLDLDDGTKAFCHYTGVVHFKDTVNLVAGGELSTMGFNDGYVTCHPKFFLDSKSVNYHWLLKQNLIGKGRFIRENGKLRVQYFIYGFNSKL